MEQYTVCLAGNPNVGKSTVFNALTGLHQHTGNWTGKTVELARGALRRGDVRFTLVDLPGIYSLSGGTPEERIAADYLDAGQPDCVIAVLDATALERSLRLALELRGRCRRMVLCLNLMDEAEKRGLAPDPQALSQALDAPVVPTRADDRRSYRLLVSTVELLCKQECSDPAPAPEGEELILRAQTLAALAAPGEGRSPRSGADRLVLGRFTAYPLVLLLLFGIFWLTIRGANLPSLWLERLFAALEGWLRGLLAPLPRHLRGLLLDGVYGTTAKVVAVMLPPMAIFFPLFTLLEDLGLLPRVAFLLDRPFACAGTCGRQALTMCMGCGCNAVGVTGCRIIPGPKQRMAAILTNALMPCNGRFPTLIFLMGSFLASRAAGSALAGAALLTAAVVVCVLVTLAVTWLLRKTLLRGTEGGFVLELPPYRKPQVGRILLRSVLDRTLRILARAVTVAAPAGAIIWVLAALPGESGTLLTDLARILDPPARLMGLRGALLLAFVLGFPANELVLPLTAMILSAGGTMAGAPSGHALLSLLQQAGMDWPMALCACVFCAFHWPCSTTVLTIRKETGSLGWTAAAILLPTAVGAVLCMALHGLLTILVRY